MSKTHKTKKLKDPKAPKNMEFQGWSLTAGANYRDPKNKGKELRLEADAKTLKDVPKGVLEDLVEAGALVPVFEETANDDS